MEGTKVYKIGLNDSGSNAGNIFVRHWQKACNANLNLILKDLYMWWACSKKGKPIKSDELARYRNVTLRTAQRYIADLKDAGLVEELEDHKYGIV